MELKRSFGQITSLVLGTKLQIDELNVTFLGKVEAAIRLGIKSWFADVVLSTHDSIYGPLVSFLKIAPF